MDTSLKHFLCGRKQSPEHIAKRTESSKKRIREILATENGKKLWSDKAKRARASQPKEAHNKTYFTPEMDAELRELYVNQRIGYRHAAKRMGLGGIVIYRRLKELGIPRRTNADYKTGIKQSPEAIAKRVAKVIGKTNPKTRAWWTPERRQKKSLDMMRSLSEGKHYRHIGHYFSEKTGQASLYRSLYERKYMQMLDSDRSVTWWEYEPAWVVIEYEFDGQVKRFKPDFWVESGDATKLVEVKSTWSVNKPKTIAKINALQNFRRENPEYGCDVIVGDGREMKHHYRIMLN